MAYDWSKGGSTGYYDFQGGSWDESWNPDTGQNNNQYVNPNPWQGNDYMPFRAPDENFTKESFRVMPTFQDYLVNGQFDTSKVPGWGSMSAREQAIVLRNLGQTNPAALAQYGITQPVAQSLQDILVDQNAAARNAESGTLTSPFTNILDRNQDTIGGAILPILSAGVGSLVGGTGTAASGMDFGGAGVGYTPAAGAGAGTSLEQLINTPPATDPLAGGGEFAPYTPDPAPYTPDPSGYGVDPAYGPPVPDATPYTPPGYDPSSPNTGGEFDTTTPGGSVESGDLTPGVGGTPGATPVVTPGTTPAVAGAGAGAGTAAAGAAAGTAISRILDGTATPADWASVLGNVAGAGLGAAASHEKVQAFQDLANQYLNMGAPSRARYEASYAPGFTMANDPGYTDALNQSATARLHGLSTQGNPADSPNAWNQSLNDLYTRTAYPALQTYRNTNAGTGFGSTINTAAQAQTGAINSNANIYNSIGSGFANIFNPPRSLEDIFRSIRTG